MNVIRRTTINKEQGGKAFAKGKKSVAICQRTGMKHLRSDMVFEPGTGYVVHRSESDGPRNLVTDALNYSSDKIGKPEGVLKYTSPDVALSVGIVVSPTSLNEVEGLPVNEFYAYPGTSVTTQE